MFKQRLEGLLEEQRQRMSQIVSIHVVDQAFDFLDANRLNSEAINRSCASELYVAINRVNDVQIDMSTRLDKYGWSTARILEHMNKIFTAKMKTIGRVLKAFIEGTDPQEALQGYTGPSMSTNSEEISSFDSKEISEAYEEFNCEDDMLNNELSTNFLSNLDDLQIS